MSRPRPTLSFAVSALSALVTIVAPAPVRAADPPPSAAPSAASPAAPTASTKAWAQSPAQAADPQIMPSPAPAEPEQPPLSTMGTDVSSTQGSAPTPPVVLGASGDDARLQAELHALEARLAEDDARLKRLDNRTRPWRNITLSAYVQPQLLIQSYNPAASPNQQGGSLPLGINANDVIAKSDGTTTNGNVFRLRRTRLRTTYETDVMRLFVQIDPLPNGGPGPRITSVLQNAEATGIVRWHRDIRTEFTAGMFVTPLRAELLETSSVRPFIERTWFIQNALPGERDIGVHARTLGSHDRLVFDVAVINGQRPGEPNFTVLPDLNKSKDLVYYLSYRLAFATLGVGGYVGRGQIVDTNQLRFTQYSRWAVNYQASLRYPIFKKLGETRLGAELTLAQNMDTGLIYPWARPAIPANFSDNVGDLDERALYVRFEQDLTKWLLAGYRYDFYSPDTAIKDNARDTHAFVAVLRISPNLRWMNEFDVAFDNVHPPGTEPPKGQILTFSSVLQAGF